LLRHRCPATQRRESGRRTDTVRRKRRPAGDVSISGEKGPRWVTRPLRHRHSLAADSGPERVPRRPGAARDGQDRLPGLHGRHDSQQGCASARLDSASLWHILVTADAHHMKRPARQTPWQPAEYRIVMRFARRLVAGRYRSLGAAADECFLELRDRSAARPGAPKHDRVYPRTYDAVRSRLSMVAVTRGFPQSFKMWTPAERLLAYKWARKFLRHRRQRPTLPLLDAARGLLADLFAVGYDRSLNACECELYKCIVDAAREVPRHCGRGPAAVALPAAVLRGTGSASAPRAGRRH